MSKYLPYHEASICKAKELCKDVTDPKEKCKAIKDFINRGFCYDYVKAINIPKRGGLPDIDGCWKKHMGICGDLAAMATGMMRAVGIKAFLVIGHANKICHAWVETPWGIYDPTLVVTKGKRPTYKKERIY